MVDFQHHILQKSKDQNKNILIIGSARSGTHALGSQLSNADLQRQYLGEICTVKDLPDPWNEIKVLAKVEPLKIAHLVAYTSKIRLTAEVQNIKKTSLLINLQRRNKVDQFASWMYFHLTGGIDGKAWHNHDIEDTIIEPATITASEQDIDQFIAEQTIDFFFCPDETVFYEDLTFDFSTYKKNQYKLYLPDIFTNLDYVRSRLENWRYPNDH